MNVRGVTLAKAAAKVPQPFSNVSWFFFRLSKLPFWTHIETWFELIQAHEGVVLQDNLLWCWDRYAARIFFSCAVHPQIQPKSSPSIESVILSSDATHHLPGRLQRPSKALLRESEVLFRPTFWPTPHQSDINTKYVDYSCRTQLLVPEHFAVFCCLCMSDISYPTIK